MALIDSKDRRYQTLAALVVGAGLLLLAGCQPSMVQPDGRPTAETAAEHMAGGRVREAAQLYERLAGQETDAARDRLLLQASRAWSRAGNAERAQANLDAVTGPMGAADLYLWSLAAADLHLLRKEPRKALESLSKAPTRGPEALIPDYYETQAEAYFQLGNAIGGIRSLVERETWMNTAAAIADNHRRIWLMLVTYGVGQYDPSDEELRDPVLSGWLLLGQIGATSRRDPLELNNRLRQWRLAYPDHPANADLVESLLAESRPADDYPQQIALLLPLTGRQAPYAAAIRDGFLAAYYEHGNSASRPVIRLYDVNASGAANAYNRALQDGAGFIVGPLTKSAVAEIPATATPEIPLLALNRLPEGQVAPVAFFQFGLSPEDEAEQAADRAIGDGRMQGVALVPDNSWGSRLLEAFANRYLAAGGTLREYRHFSARRKDHGDTITDLLQLDNSKRRHAELVRTIGTPLVFEPRRRQDIDFIFLAARPEQGRLLRPELKFHFAANLPVYSTSAIYEPDVSRNRDLNGIMFADIPWILDPTQVDEALHLAIGDLWPNLGALERRLFAMGFDAYRLVPRLRSPDEAGTTTLSGLTGELEVGPDGIVRRHLMWAQFRRSVPVVLPVIEPQTPVSGLLTVGSP